eukprot:scaffold611481_cov39-Prasinocladus_malaysianus.AAC.1
MRHRSPDHRKTAVRKRQQQLYSTVTTGCTAPRLPSRLPSSWQPPLSPETTIAEHHMRRSDFFPNLDSKWVPLHRPAAQLIWPARHAKRYGSPNPKPSEPEESTQFSLPAR